MKTRAGKRMILVYLIGSLSGGMMTLPAWGADSAREPQLLVNPDFSQALVGDTPPGWFRAMMPHLTKGLQAGVGHDEAGVYLFLEQEGVQGQLFNNWAQRLEQPPIGRTLRLEAEVATQDAQGKGAVVLLMFFDKDGRVVGGASSEGRYDLTGTKEPTPVRLEAIVPPEADLAIVRLGLSPASGRMQVCSARLCLVDGEQGRPAAATPPSGTQEEQAGLELLANGDFEGLVMFDTPLGWFRAMLPDQVINHRAGVQNLAGHANVAFIRQDGVKARVVNNWAQRLEVVPAGARLRLTADVKTEDLPENTGFVMVQCWDESERLLAAATSQSDQPLGGTQDWRTVSMELTVPAQTTTIIVRCGLAQSGTIWFDNVSLKVVSPSALRPVEATGESLERLELVQTLSEELAAYCRERLGQKVGIRKQVRVQRDGTFQVALLLDFSGR